jgi:hypothetical protein
MKILSLPSLTLALSMATSAVAGDVEETMRGFEEGAFKVDVECTENAAKQFLGGTPASFVSRVGVIEGQGNGFQVRLDIEGEQAENPHGFIRTITVGRQLSAVIEGLTQNFQAEAVAQEVSVEEQLSPELRSGLETLDQMLSQCTGPAPLLS